ncbi:MAG TPA: Dabb family protein [Pirellulales bacterium]|nr:Dabb family protein [Pirellulales bacterium]
MRMVLLLATVFLCGGFAMTFADRASARAGEKSSQVLRHIVLYKFKDDATPAQVQEVVATFAALPKKIDGIVGFEHGTNVSPEGKSDGLTHVFVVSFVDEKARDAYLVHPAHQAYVNVVKDRREKVVVFDYWADR